jgi:cysteine desulfurase / selenocysteine lyase
MSDLGAGSSASSGASQGAAQPTERSAGLAKDVFDVDQIKKDFPFFERTIDDKRIVFLDSANSAQKPRQVIDAMSDFMANHYSPINRSSYRMAAEATDLFEGARANVARFINAPSASEVIFTKNATESLNLVVQTWGRVNLGPNDAIVLTHMEHHANIVPWQMLSVEKGFEIRWVPLTDDGQLDLTTLPTLLSGAKVFSFTAMSNVLGTLTPIRALTDAAHEAGAIAIVDGCQFVPHNVTDVRAMGCDFFAFSSHKLCGPTGIGVLWGRSDLLNAMPPFLGGGSMIDDVSLTGFVTAPIPGKFEAGTPPIVEAIGLSAAIDYMRALGMDNVRAHEIAMSRYALDALKERFGDDITIYGPTNVEVRGATISFGFKGIHPHDISQVLDESNVCVRAGHHCAKPLMRVLQAGATVRACFFIYNDEADVQALIDGLDNVTDLFL